MIHWSSVLVDVLKCCLFLALISLVLPHRYGDRSPKSALGRVFCILWIITGVIIISIFTALVTASLSASTVKVFRIHGSKVVVKLTCLFRAKSLRFKMTMWILYRQIRIGTSVLRLRKGLPSLTWKWYYSSFESSNMKQYGERSLPDTAGLLWSVFTWRNGGHVGIKNIAKKSLGNLSLLLLCSIFCYCFVYQHGRLITFCFVLVEKHAN